MTSLNFNMQRFAGQAQGFFGYTPVEAPKTHAFRGPAPAVDPRFSGDLLQGVRSAFSADGVGGQIVAGGMSTMGFGQRLSSGSFFQAFG